MRLEESPHISPLLFHPSILHPPSQSSREEIREWEIPLGTLSPFFSLFPPPHSLLLPHPLFSSISLPSPVIPAPVFAKLSISQLRESYGWPPRPPNSARCCFRTSIGRGILQKHCRVSQSRCLHGVWPTRGL